ncbi:hypothetical protein CCP3SC15_20016 [Gammaproteobacteria bacterium]
MSVTAILHQDEKPIPALPSIGLDYATNYTNRMGDAN